MVPPLNPRRGMPLHGINTLPNQSILKSKRRSIVHLKLFSKVKCSCRGTQSEACGEEDGPLVPQSVSRRLSFGTLAVHIGAAHGILVDSARGEGHSAIVGDQTSLRQREAKMVIRVLALRNSVPQQWLLDFRTALEGYGIPAVSFKPEMKDIWAELEGKPGKQGGKRTTVDLVTLGDAWLSAAIRKDLIQPIENPERYRYWVRCVWAYVVLMPFPVLLVWYMAFAVLFAIKGLNLIAEFDEQTMEKDINEIPEWKIYLEW